jgi:hypothetical protein
MGDSFRAARGKSLLDGCVYWQLSPLIFAMVVWAVPIGRFGRHSKFQHTAPYPRSSRSHDCNRQDKPQRPQVATLEGGFPWHLGRALTICYHPSEGVTVIAARHPTQWEQLIATWKEFTILERSVLIFSGLISYGSVTQVKGEIIHNSYDPDPVAVVAPTSLKPSPMADRPVRLE